MSQKSPHGRRICKKDAAAERLLVGDGQRRAAAAVFARAGLRPRYDTMRS
jgi:hypothetical protein